MLGDAAPQVAEEDVDLDSDDEHCAATSSSTFRLQSCRRTKLGGGGGGGGSKGSGGGKPAVATPQKSKAMFCVEFKVSVLANVYL